MRISSNRYDVYDFMHDLLELHNRKKESKKKKKNIRIDLKNYEVFKLLNCKFIYVFMISTNYHFYIYFYNKYGKEIDKKM